MIANAMYSVLDIFFRGFVSGVGLTLITVVLVLYFKK